MACNPTEKPTTNQSPNVPAPYPSAQTSKPTAHSANGSTATDYSTNKPTVTLARIVMDYIESKKDLIETSVLVSYNRASGLSYPSKQYTIRGFMQSLKIMGVDGFGADFKFMLWEGAGEQWNEEWMYGLVNLAAFLANCMVEAIEDDTCDELNWQEFEGKYAISNSCGQEGRSYEDEDCALGTTEFLSCDVDQSMQVTAVSRGTQMRAPPPLKCQSGTGDENLAGYWDSPSGRRVQNVEYANVAGRTDIEGCCFFGRGALLTRGICQIGKINYYLGKRGAELGRSTLYPKLDFCQYPEVTCTSANGEQLRWTTAFFEWSERVQRYQRNGWNFEDQLAQFVEGGMTSDSFITGVSRILSRGCHESGCSEIGEVRMLNKRITNFFMIVNDVLDLKSPETPKATFKPTRQPTQRPTNNISPTAGFPAGMPTPQQITMRPIIPNPTEIQNNMNSSPVTPGAQPMQTPSNDGLVAQLEPPLSNDGNVAKATSLPTYYTSLPTYDNAYGGDELIGIEGNAAGRIYAKQMFQIILLLVQVYYHVIIMQ
eukprot:CAMPEP_0172329518 /NCGR_PEP_ID=MMETSP1058-20130122/60926_1 /TAXON_ID=83371 /ORGANISM="Detonula confervacea, Strain CCMP 353" /LENGTH=540 /DNA_ID=CAMNT_0013046697 /DNA_START=554 /DNA_END=2176 /DNA_ORIENTATION=-